MRGLLFALGAIVSFISSAGAATWWEAHPDPATEKMKAGGMGSGANAADPRFAAATVPEALLFNLAQDPNETNNLTAKYPDKAAELAKELKAIVAQGEGTKKTKAKP